MTQQKMLVLVAVVFGLPLFAADCPTDLLKGFGGTFKGVLSPVSFKGERQPLQNMVETHTVTSCTSLDADIHYSNPETGRETREVKFSGQWDEAKKGFVLTGPVLQGTLQVIRPGALFSVHFNTKFAGSPAYCDETISVAFRGTQVIRSVHCFDGDVNGPSLGVRTALTTKVH